uniref:NADH dehydrogenase subunit 6 n=1 Tax=Menacanthus cornutus TaxID=1491751 RepID=UPI002001C398|nr:NADH dehydrogenase subunit 6 [Menacanthus cornutus]UNZ13000.1 NADH dehydrogenase subunit 6 [Menacanthus cornutus]
MMVSFLFSLLFLFSVMFSLVEHVVSVFIILILSFSSSCLIIYFITFNTWSLMLLMIMMFSGLFVIFFYIVSTEPEKPLVNYKYSIYPMFLILIFSIIQHFDIMEYCFMDVNHMDKPCGLLVQEVTIILLFLVALVVMYIRLTYSKSGSLRKKF